MTLGYFGFQNTFFRDSFWNSLDLQIHYFTIHIAKIHKVDALPVWLYINGISLHVWNWFDSTRGSQLNSSENILNLVMECIEHINTCTLVPNKMRFCEMHFEIHLTCKFIISRQTYPGFRNIYSCLAPAEVRHCSKNSKQYQWVRFPCYKSYSKIHWLFCTKMQRCTKINFGGPEGTSLHKFFTALHNFWLVWKKYMIMYI